MASEPNPSGPRRPRTRGRRVALGALAGIATFAALLVLDGIWERIVKTAVDEQIDLSLHGLFLFPKAL